MEFCGSLKRVMGGALLAWACASVMAHGQEPEAAQKGMWQPAHPLTVERGVLTVDGMVIKTGLQFRVADLRYLYIDLPGEGTAVISDRLFTGAREQKGAFRRGVLTVLAGDHRLQLSAARRVHGNGSAFVRMEPESRSGSRMPEIGYQSAAMSRVTWVQDAGGAIARRRPVRVNAGRRLREARLCRPSRRGPEKCAVVREVRLHE